MNRRVSLDEWTDKFAKQLRDDIRVTGKSVPEADLDRYVMILVRQWVRDLIDSEKIFEVEE